MHASVMAWMSEQARTLRFDSAPRILEVGSADVNGSVRPVLEALLRPVQYVGLDLAPGPGVDVAMPGGVQAFPGEEQFDLVVSCEMLEHCRDWTGGVRAMARLLRRGGVLLLTCRGPGFPIHNVPDHWRFTPEDLVAAARACGLGAPGCGDGAWPDPQVPGAFLRATKLKMPTVQRSGWIGE